jgi:hypothetical protein
MPLEQREKELAAIGASVALDAGLDLHQIRLAVVRA